jgi:4-coumarate--CoA ligase
VIILVPRTVTKIHFESVANPGFSVEELVPHFREAKPTLLIVQPDAFLTAREACLLSGLDSERIVLIDSPPAQVRGSLNVVATHFPPTVQELADFGAQYTPLPFMDFKLKTGEGQSKAAILFPSSGTTGSPKLIAVSHYAFIANILQAVAHDRAGNVPRRYNPGDVSCAGMCISFSL